MVGFIADDRLYPIAKDDVTILGIDCYYDPFEEKEVELPNGYDHVLCNNLGEYVMTYNQKQLTY
jgi:hypothetical protein